MHRHLPEQGVCQGNNKQTGYASCTETFNPILHGEREGQTKAREHVSKAAGVGLAPRGSPETEEGDDDRRPWGGRHPGSDEERHHSGKGEVDGRRGEVTC
jgi:hypothetical protein